MSHLTFEEQPAETATPCVCWDAGYAMLARPELYQHPDEWRDGLRTRGDYEADR